MQFSAMSIDAIGKSMLKPKKKQDISQPQSVDSLDSIVKRIESDLNKLKK